VSQTGMLVGAERWHRAVEWGGAAVAAGGGVERGDDGRWGREGRQHVDLATGYRERARRGGAVD
jgi:hypothetical protein